ncbi:hypothetical protein HYH03_009383 [Edaphochlamys debaryana]|uniref:Uncharacterized protein n=1 Tax=Edaphochlamys debaryana TaxID=47281 RepID=A0A835Y4N6_9CHLO|nr:hypothetical protein HYH03_009383 [Edaphochlamys debaryana]|eukprot:KAG2492440.1 hypothetical protein HYH03_009383 [Edaphochlamys debaryana]
MLLLRTRGAPSSRHVHPWSVLRLPSLLWTWASSSARRCVWSRGACSPPRPPFFLTSTLCGVEPTFPSAPSLGLVGKPAAPALPFPEALAKAKTLRLILPTGPRPRLIRGVVWVCV